MRLEFKVCDLENIQVSKQGVTREGVLAGRPTWELKDPRSKVSDRIGVERVTAECQDPEERG